MRIFEKLLAAFLVIFTGCMTDMTITLAKEQVNPSIWAILPLVFLFWGHIQTTDAYLWSAAVSILDPRKETWWEILLFFFFPGPSFLSAAQTEINRHLQRLSVLWKCMKDNRRCVFPYIYLWVRSMQHEGGDAARAPQIRSNTGPPRRCFHAPRCPTAAWL